MEVGVDAQGGEQARLPSGGRLSFALSSVLLLPLQRLRASIYYSASREQGDCRRGQGDAGELPEGLQGLHGLEAGVGSTANRPQNGRAHHQNAHSANSEEEEDAALSLPSGTCRHPERFEVLCQLHLQWDKVSCWEMPNLPLPMPRECLHVVLVVRALLVLEHDLLLTLLSSVRHTSKWSSTSQSWQCNAFRWTRRSR